MVVLQVNPIHPGQNSSDTNAPGKSFTASDLKPGEILTVKIVEKLSQNQYLLAYKNTTLKAVSDVFLKSDANLNVRVQSTNPQIILSVLNDQPSLESSKIQDGLIQWRMHPDALVKLFGNFSQIFGKIDSDQLPPTINKRIIEPMLKMMQSMIFSSQTQNDSMFVEKFAKSLGMFLESDLRNAVLESGMGKKNVEIGDNMKALSLKMLSENALQSSTTPQTQVLNIGQSLGALASEMLQMIESRQIMNVVYQDNKSGFYLQIPILQEQNFRQADVFIFPDDKKAVGLKKFSTCSVFVFLNLDRLGEMAVEATLRHGKIKCLIKCENESTKQLMTDSVQKLQQSLNAVGYGIDSIRCLKGSELENRRREFIDEQIQGSKDLVNRYI